LTNIKIKGQTYTLFWKKDKRKKKIADTDQLSSATTGHLIKKKT
jgi:hypothetical protein